VREPLTVTSGEARREGGSLPRIDGVTFVETVGDGSMDLCARELARELPAPTLTTDIYARAGTARNASLLAPASLRAAMAGAAFTRELRRLETAVHLPNQHLARYALAAGRPYVVTVHDLIRLLDQRSDEPLIHRPNLRDRLTLTLDYRAVARADAVIVISAATRRDVIEHLGVSPERVFVVHNGLDHDRFRPVGGERPYPEPYVLYVGSEQPRKNLRTLLRAMRRIKDARGGRGVKLVKVGAAGGCEARFREETERTIDELDLRDDVHFAGRVEDGELPRWYSHAECLVLPSLYEGFGNPALEAMACGCPVVVSDIPALTEVVDGTGLSVPPCDDATLADAVQAVVSDGDLRADLAARGLVRARSFTWRRAAEQTLEVYSTFWPTAVARD
jgi:glycosyltransferase involved in cell wall biosynthesis